MATAYKSSLARQPPATSSQQREQCFLCDTHKWPWTLLREFTEVVCRGCVNYEGSDRVETIIDQARLLKNDYSSDPNAKLSRSYNKSPASTSPFKHSGISQEKLTSTGVMPTQPTTPIDYLPGFIKDSMPSPAALQFQREGKQNSSIPPSFLDLSARGFGAVHAASQSSLSVTATQPLMSPAASLAYRQGMIAARMAATASCVNWNRFSTSPPSAVSEDSSSPGTPSEESKPLTAPLTLDYSSKPPHVVKALQTLARATPFEVRFKKAHQEKGRVFAVDASLKTGTEYDLKLYIEYPTGSGQVYTSASGVAKQMCKNSLREMSRTLSSGFKYLEYEVQPDIGDWRLILDLLPEAVRSFKESAREELIPVPRIDPNFPTLPKFSINLSASKLYGDSNNNMNNSPAAVTSPGSGKRKVMALDMSDMAAFPPKRLSTESPAARRPTSLTLAMPSPTQAPLKSPYTSTQSLAPPTPTNGFSFTSPQRSPGYSIQRQSSTTPPDVDIMKCFLCCSQLEDTHFVQCPAIGDHKFCFPCSKDSIKQQGVKSEIFCPSGKRCRLSGSKTLPWAFMPAEITQILSTQIAPKFRYDRIVSSQSLDSNREKSISP
ncbi:interferon regulatory factor 2-binding protein-like B [Watersipora subatra]|uniref:interferon regulatory factor 2-binding protein-like B n=1 Tax=Watersipora subatra TaxID=2589382 RepID=UPI00355B3863